MFVVLEGIDGCGTTTQAAKLSDALALHDPDHRVWMEHEPTQSEIGQLIRKAIRERSDEQYTDFDWRVMAMLFSADRQLHSNRLIEPALRRGDHVICDRYHFSTICYQLVSSDDDESPSHRYWLTDLGSRVAQPDLTIILDLPLEEALERIAERAQLTGQARDIYERYDFLKRVHALYQRIPLNHHVHRISGTGTPAEVFERIRNIVL